VLATALAARYKDRVEFRILGPLEVVDREGAVSFDAPKQRALLGVLLLHPNEVVSSERLIDELWGERPPTTAAKVLRTYVSQLRRALGPDAIITRSPGYSLRIEEEALDAECFRRLATEARGLAANGDRERADALYREALGLWRGPPLADVAFESFARNEVERLAEERLDALTARIDCELALGRNGEVVAELESLVRRYPLRERLRAQLMLALYRSGRQTDALAVYQDARRALIDELGLEPSRELQDLERAILTHDPALEPPPPIEPAPQGDTAAGAAEKALAPSRLLRKPALTLAALLLLAGALGLVFTLRRDHPASMLLAPNSVGFIDAKSGRLTRSFPVGREPSALTVTDDSVWVANYRDQTVTRIDPATGPKAAIPVGGHPSGIAAYRGTIWVWTLEGLLARIDPRYDSASNPIRLAPTGGTVKAPGKIAVGEGFLWITVPDVTVLRVDPAHPDRAQTIVPDWGAGGPIAERAGEAWAAGSSYGGYVFPIDVRTRLPGSGIAVGGPVHDLAVGAGSLWVLSGGAVREQPYPALREVDLHDQLVRSTVAVGNDPVALADAAGSIWVASAREETISRVDPSRGRVVETIKVGASPTALAADRDGIWVAVG
jgi:DNA-binding SARP family transcriptional activator/DNA-binding beta-propeller fold protein YncE